jgi:hypothetical protein
MKNLIILFFLLNLVSCTKQEIKFDKDSWNDRDDIFYKNRELMASDLTKNHLKSGMKYSEVISFLGQPENIQSPKDGEIIYELQVEYGSDIDPISGKNLILNFSKDSILSKYKIEDWK